MGWHASLGMWAVLSILALILWLPHVRNGRRGEVYVASRNTEKPVRLISSSLAWYITLFMGIQSLIFIRPLPGCPKFCLRRVLTHLQQD